MLPMDPERLYKEIEQVLEIVSDIKSRLDRGIPGEDAPARDLDAEIFSMRMIRELLLASQRLQTLAELLGDV